MGAMLMKPSPEPTTDPFGHALSLLAWIVASGHTAKPLASGTNPAGSASVRDFTFAGREPSGFLTVVSQLRSTCALGTTFDPFFAFANFGLAGLKPTVPVVCSPAANAGAAATASAASASSATQPGSPALRMSLSLWLTHRRAASPEGAVRR